MDTSETYIKMCARAKEIQSLKVADTPFQAGEWWVSKRWADTILCTWRAYKTRDDIWLPCQDQLQEMILAGYVPQVGRHLLVYWLLHKFEHWLPDYRYIATSMEQLWLAFVMHEKYGKVWNGEEWIR